MQLSAELFDEILTGLRSDGSPDRSHRESPRVGVSMTLTIFPDPPGDGPRQLRVRVRDISRVGLGLLSSRRYPVGQKFTFELSRVNGVGTTIVVCETVHSERVADRIFLIGVRFIPDQIHRVSLSRA